MRAVNLLPRDAERQPRQGGRGPLFVLAGGVAAVVAAGVVLTFSASSTVSAHKADLEAAEATIAALERDASGGVSTTALAQERTNRVAALSAAFSNRVPFDGLLRQIAYVLPADAWLTGMTASAAADAATTPPGTAPAAVPTQGIEIQGATYSQASVARVLARLSLLRSLAGVRLGSSGKVVVGAVAGADGKQVKKGKTVVTFVIDASLAGGAS